MADHLLATDETFETEILQSDLPVLVDFWAPWCGPCRMVGPVVDELAKDFEGRIKTAKMNVDDNPRTPAKYGIRGIPTLILFKGGEIAGQIVGAVPKSRLEELLNANV